MNWCHADVSCCYTFSLSHSLSHPLQPEICPLPLPARGWITLKRRHKCSFSVFSWPVTVTSSCNQSSLLCLHFRPTADIHLFQKLPPQSYPPHTHTRTRTHQAHQSLHPRPCCTYKHTSVWNLLVNFITWLHANYAETAVGETEDGAGRASWYYRCRTGAVMRCHTGCCSWKSRPPFSALGALLSAAILASFSGDSPLLLQRSLDVQGAPSIHFARVRLPGWVTMATHSFRLCHMNSNPSSFFSPFFSREPKKKSRSRAQKNSPRKNAPERRGRSSAAAGFVLPPGRLFLLFPPSLPQSSAQTAVCR